MAEVVVRGIEPEVLGRLEERARKNGRSLEAELRAILRDAVTPEPVSWREDLARLQALFAGRHFSDSSELIREDRGR